MIDAATRLALARARMGVPRGALPELDQETLEVFLGDYALAQAAQLPRAVRRAGQEIAGNAILDAASWGFWIGVAYVMQRDQET